MPRSPRQLAIVTEAPAARGAAPDAPALAPGRQRQRVVVRSPGTRVSLEALPGDRPHFPTLSGLGFRDDDDAPGDGHEAEPVSRVRARVSPRVPPVACSLILPPRTRPVTLLDGVHDDVARKYREEAERLLASGIFDGDDFE